MGDAYPVPGGAARRDPWHDHERGGAFARTLDAGTVQLEEALIPVTGAERVVGRSFEHLAADAPVLPGDVAFRLHDTYGFPIDLTVELAGEYGVRVDRAGLRGRARRAARSQPLGGKRPTWPARPSCGAL